MDNQEQAAHKGRTFSELKESISNGFTSMESSADLVIMLLYSITLWAPLRICVEAGIFRRLASTQEPISATDLANNIEGQSPTSTPEESTQREEFLIRMLRALVGLNLIDETGPSTYLANNLTLALADPGFEAGVSMFFANTFGPKSVTHSLFDWAKNNGYRAPQTSTDGPVQRAFDIVGKTTFERWTHDDGESMSQLSALMQRVQKGRLNWSAWFPANILFPSGGTTQDDRVFMVDVGGGFAHDLSGLAQQYPDRTLQLICQDQPEVIAEAREVKDLDSRIKLVEHNFFQPQPVKGASIYFMHKIMHDWPDRDCITILSHLRDAMASDSRLFLNDCIIPDQGSPLIFSAFDIGMLTWLSAKERSESMWKRLISQVEGLEIRNFWQAPGLKGEGIVEVGKIS